MFSVGTVPLESNKAIWSTEQLLHKSG